MSKLQDFRQANRTGPTLQGRRVDHGQSVVTTNRRLSLDYEEYPSKSGSKLLYNQTSPNRRPLQPATTRRTPIAAPTPTQHPIVTPRRASQPPPPPASPEHGINTGTKTHGRRRTEESAYVPSSFEPKRGGNTDGSFPDTTATNTSTEIDGRPKTSHGRRRPPMGSTGDMVSHPMGLQREFTVVDDFVEARPKTSHGRRRPIPEPALDSTDSDEEELKIITPTPLEEAPRSTSVLKYTKPLPDISGSGLSTAPPNVPTPRPPTTDRMKEPQVLVVADTLEIPGVQDILPETVAEDDPTLEMSPEPKYKPVALPSEPDGAERRILLAIKMPSGERVQRYFRLTETLDIVLKFAEFMAHRHFEGHRFVSAAPRVVYDKMDTKLSDSGLKDRTVLFLQPP